MLSVLSSVFQFNRLPAFQLPSFYAAQRSLDGTGSRTGPYGRDRPPTDRLMIKTLVVLSCLVVPLAAQDDAPHYRALNLGVNDIGLSIGNSRRWAGLRINFQDNRVERVTGVGVTIWSEITRSDFSFSAARKMLRTKLPPLLALPPAP